MTSHGRTRSLAPIVLFLTLAACGSPGAEWVVAKPAAE
jgi:hypothetical protein